MTAMASDEAIRACAAVDDPGCQETILADAGVLNTDGLHDVLDVALEFVHDAPSRAIRLASCAERFAETMGDLRIVARALYVNAQAHALSGKLNEAYALVDQAHDTYLDLDATVDAARTNLGRMHILNELGRHAAAVEAGDALLATVADASASGDMTTHEASLMTARVEQNRGVCLEHMGRHVDALGAYERAEDGFRANGDARSVGDVSNNRGVVLLRLGRAREALDVFSTAVAVHSESESSSSLGASLANLGTAHMALGRYSDSLDALDRARGIMDELGTLDHEPLLHLDMADTYLALNLYPEATRAYRHAAEILEAAGMEHHRADALLGTGVALIAAGRLAEAEGMLAEAEAIFREAGNEPKLSAVRLEQSALHHAAGRTADASDAAHEAADLADTDNSPVQRTFAHLRLFDLSMPDTKGARSHLDEAERMAEVVALPPLRHRFRSRRGRVALLEGNLAEARRELEQAVEDIERMRGTMRTMVTRRAFFRDKAAAYEDLVSVYASESHVRRAFDTAERARARSLLDAMAAERRHAVAAPADQIAKLDDDLHALYDRILSESTDELWSAQATQRRESALELESRLGLLRLQASSPSGQQDLFASLLDADEILSVLPDDITLVSYFMARDEVMAFTLSAGVIDVHRNLASRDEVRQLLGQMDLQWDRCRVGAGMSEQHRDLLVKSAQRPLHELYTRLIAPLGLPGGPPLRPAKLVIVPHDILHGVPFHALFDGSRYLVDRSEVGYAPSVNLFVNGSRKLADLRTGPSAVFGVPDPLIPFVAAEVRAVAARTPQPVTRVGREATRDAFFETVSGRSIIHLACHGLFRSDNPLYSALRLGDGWLKAADLTELDLDGALVTLGACESGRGSIEPGEESLGLARGFLGAGAGAVVVSAWLLQDTTTASFMSDLYDHIGAGMTPGAAIRNAQLALRERHPHPFYWAPFQAIGDCL